MSLNLFIHLLIFHSIFYLLNSQNQYYLIQPHDISALIGSNITIPCVIVPPHGDVQWTKDGLALGYDRQLPAFPSWSIIGDEKRGEFNFFIQSLQLDDEGIFACEVSPYNDSPSLKQIAHIRTLVQPKYVTINNQPLKNKITIINIRFDEIIHQIDCRVNGARPAAHIRWINETNHEYPATSRIFSQNRLFSTISTLTLVPSLSLNKKRFTCTVHHETFNNTNKIHNSFEINIISPPSIPIIRGYSSKYYLINGSNLILSCQSIGGHPLGNISWYRLENNNKTLNLINNSSIIYQENNLIENNISLIITPSYNNIIFSCHVINDYLYSLGQTLQTNITLQVAFGPSTVHIEDNNMNVTTLIDEIPRKFICKISSSNPRAIVVWKLDGQILPSDIDPLEEIGEFFGTKIQLIKTIGLDKSLKEYHKKILSCEARNPITGHIISDSTRLNIIYDATNIEMHGITKDEIIKSGDKMTVECILFGGNPLGKIVWYKGDKLLNSEDIIETNKSYVLSRVEFIVSASDNNLPLTCKGQVENFSQRIASFILNITYLPEEVFIINNELFSNLSINDNNTRREFECRTSSSNPQAQLTIIRQTNDGQKHFDIQYKTSSSYINEINSIKFMLPEIDLSLHGNRLTCQATLDTDTLPLIKQVTYILNVNHKPYFNDFNKSIEIKENQLFNITLQANGYPLPISYTWFHPSGRHLINDQLNIFINQGQLTILNIHRSDLGIYRCIATNIIGSAQVNFTLNVLYGPIIIRTQGYSILEAIKPDSSAILLCIVDANPISLNNVRWLKNNQEISFEKWEKRIEGNEISLIKKSIHRDDAGEYSCEIDNQLGKTRAILPLIVQYAPEIDRSDPSRNKAATDSNRFLTAELHCYVSAIPKPTVIWMKNNQILPLSSKYQSKLNEQNSSSLFSPNLLFDAILYIANITKPDYGTYQCKIENTLGTDMMEIILTGLTIPDPPKQIQLTNISYSSVLINWIPGFNGGANQTFQIRYRLSTDDRYFYEHIPYGIESFNLKNLKLGKEYYVNIRSNNSYYLSDWSNDIIIKTLTYIPLKKYHLSEFSSKDISLTIIIIIAIFGLLVILFNIILLSFFIIKRRRTNITSENSSTTDTNDTETNTVDIFQPIPSNFFLTPITINSYKKYEDEDIKQPFVSSYSTTNIPTYTTIKKERFSPYDNIQLEHYYPSNTENNFKQHRSFKKQVNNTSNVHECIRAELV